MKVIYTVEVDPGDCPEIRGRLRTGDRWVGSWVVKAIRESMKEAIYVWHPTERYGGDPATYREPKIGRITMRIEGPRDTYEEHEDKPA